MVLTFPHFGRAHDFGALLFREMGISLVTPEANGPEVLERGIKICPVEVCLPLKLMAANLEDAWKQGADTVMLPATMGPCRLGEYGELLKQLLDERGCCFHWILLDAVQAIGKKEFRMRLKEISGAGTCGTGKTGMLLLGTYRLICKTEKAEARALADGNQETLQKIQLILKNATGIQDALKQMGQLCGGRRLGDVKDGALRGSGRNGETGYPNATPLRILLTGEIFSLIDSFGHGRVKNVCLRQGVSLTMTPTIGWWIRHAVCDMLGATKGSVWLKHSIGGYARETIRAIRGAEAAGFDGVIQILPAGCMPEIVVKAVLENRRGEREIPVLTLLYDEMTGDAGLDTRLEAFFDMLQRRRERQGRVSGTVSVGENEERRVSRGKGRLIRRLQRKKEQGFRYSQGKGKGKRLGFR